MREWKARDTVMLLFMLAVVGIMLMQMVQNDRLYTRVSQLIQQLESGGSVAGAAISPDRPAGTQPAGSWAVPGAEPGGTVIVHYAAQPANLNPLTGKDIYNSYILSRRGLVYPSLLDYDGNSLELVNVMAESWSISPDKLAITIKIRPEVRWSDGKPLTARDVVFSFRVMMMPDVDDMSLQGFYVDCEKVEATDERTVVFHWKRPYFKALEASAQVPIIPQHVIDPDNLLEKNPKELAKRINAWDFLWNGKPQVVCGPYYPESWDKIANRVVLRRNENYWGPKPPLKQIVFRFISNDDAALQALKAGEFDAMFLTTEQWNNQTGDKAFLDQFVKRKYFRVDGGFLFIGWNTRRAPFDDPRVRQAMSYCMPRELIRQKILYGLAELSNGPFNPFGNQTSPKVGQWPFDLAKAKELLIQAGFKDPGNGILERNGRPLDFALTMPAGSSMYDQIMSLYQDELAKIGVKMRIDPYEWSVFSQRMDEHNFDAAIMGWGGVVEEDPYQIWYSGSYENKGSNFIGYKNPEVDRLILAGREEFDPAKRNEIFHRVHELLFADQPYTFLFTQPTLMAQSKRLENVNVDKLGIDFKEWWVPRALRRAGE